MCPNVVPRSARRTWKTFWIRSQDDCLDPTGDVKKVDQLCPKKAGQNPNDSAEEIEDALDWIRVHNKFVLDAHQGCGGNDVPFGQHSTMLLSPPIEKLGSIPVSFRTPEYREKDIDNILRWLRNGKDDSDDPTGEFGRSIRWSPVSHDRSRSELQ